MDGPPPQEEDFSALPISEKLAHKNWKARVNGYESLIKTFQTTASDSDPAFRPYISNPDLLKKIVTDPNAVAQEKGVECLVALVKFAGETAAKTRDAVLPALVDKCIGSSRVGTKNQAIELILQYVEVENSGAGVVADIVPGLAAKQPKTVAAGVLALKEVLRVFGTQVTPPAPILKALPKIFAHADKNVRAEGTQLTHTLYQYIGLAIDPWLAELKPVQVKELQEAFESMEKEGKGKGTLRAERFTREHQREAEANPDAGTSGDTADVGAAEELDLPDPRSLAEPVDIVPKLPSNLQTNLTSSKWKERKEALDELLTLVNASPRIQDAPELAELAKSLASCIYKDANINCVMTAANVMEGLAKGLMHPFERLRETVVPPMLERLKERKVNVTDAIGAALDAIFTTTSLPNMIPDLLPALSNKNPQVKEGTLKFLARCLTTSTTPVQPGQVKSLTDPLAVLLEDSFEGARNEAASCLGTLMKMVGERPLNALMDGLADVRKAKVKEAYDKATVKCKAGSGAPPKPLPAVKEPSKKSAPAKAPVQAIPDVLLPPSPTAEDALLQDGPPKKPTGKPLARLLAKKGAQANGDASADATPKTSAPETAAPTAKKAVPAVAAKSAKPLAPAPPSALDSFKYKHTPEDAEALAASLIPESAMGGLGDANWKARLAACDEMAGWLEGIIQDVDAEIVVRAIAKKGWNEKNFQVSAKLYGILNTLAERCPSFGKSCVALSTGHLSEKLGDAKLKKSAGETLTVFAEKTSLQFVLNQAYEPLGKQKAPKVLADALTWVDTALVEFGTAGVSLRNLIEFLKTALKNSNAAVRTSATKTLVTVKLFAGAGIKDFLEDINPQLLGTIQGEFDKVEGAPAPQPSRTSVDVASMVPASATGGKGAADALDDLFPRVELDGLLKGTTILADSKNDAWKTKKEALETLQAILDQGANKRLKPTMGEIAQVLKARVADTNKAVQSLALDIVARIATGMGKPFDKHTKFFVVPVATVLSDQKAPIRAAAIQTLTAMANACEGLDSMIHFLGTALEVTNPTQRASLLGWISDYFKESPPSSSLDLSSWAGTVVSSLDDRSADVRKGAQALLPPLITSVGFEKVMAHTNALKPASRKTAIPIIQSAKELATPPQVSAPPAKPVARSSVDTTVPQPSPTPPPSPLSVVTVPPAVHSKPSGVRRKLPQGTVRPDSREEPIEEPSNATKSSGKAGLKRPGVAVPVAKAVAPTALSNLPFSSMSMEAKRARLTKDLQKWINEAGPTRKDLADLLQHQMEPHTSKELIGQLFSHDHSAVNDHVSGLSTIQEFFLAASSGEDKYGTSVDDMRAIGLACSDLALKYVSIKAHEPQSNLSSKCLDVIEAVVSFLRNVDAQIEDSEALCFIPTFIYKLGDAREPIRVRVQNIVQSLPKVYAYSRVFDLLLEHGLRAKVAKTRQGALDELANLLKRNGMGACNQPNKAFPIVGSMIADKDSAVRKSALSVLSEVFVLAGEKVWSLVGTLSPKDKTQLEERLRRVAGPSSPSKLEHQTPAPPPQVARLANISSRPESPSAGKLGGIPRSASPAGSTTYHLVRPSSPGQSLRSISPAPSQLAGQLSPPPRGTSKLPGPSGVTAPSATSASGIPSVTFASGLRPKSMLPSRLAQPRSVTRPSVPALSTNAAIRSADEPSELPYVARTNGSQITETPPLPSSDTIDTLVDSAPSCDDVSASGANDITITISSILSSDPSRSVDALKKIQKILMTKPEDGHASSEYRDLAEHTEGLIETITLQMTHIFERPEDVLLDENFRLAKHLIQTLNTFCDHTFLAESLTVEILTPLLEELTLRLLETDESAVAKVKDLSRFINMIILRLFATGRRMSIFRSLFALLLQIVKPFPSAGTPLESKESRVAELVLKCVWKLARNIPQDLKEHKLDPVELLPAVEHFLQSVPPNEWRARATNKIPCGDMPLRTVKVIIQHVVAHYGDETYDILSASFDDPSATIVYPYVYRILNSASKPTEPPTRTSASPQDPISRPYSAASSRPISPAGSASANNRRSSPSHRTSPSVSSHNCFSPPVEEPDPEAQLITIINHISSETTGAMHKEGITELHHFLKNYPHKRPKVEKLLETTGPAFRKYINRALASRAAEDLERTVAVASTLSKLEANGNDEPNPSSPVGGVPRSPLHAPVPVGEDRLHKLHDIFQYKRASVTSNGSSAGASKPRPSVE